MFFIRLLSMGIVLLAAQHLQAQVLYEGKLGPIKYEMSGVKKEVKPQLRNAVRERLKPMFSGEGEVVYRIDFKVRSDDLVGISPKKGTIGLVKAKWRVTMEMSRFRPDQESLAVASFPLWANLLTTEYRYHHIKRGGPTGTAHPQYQLIKLLPARMEIALRDFRDQDVSMSLAGLNRKMDKPIHVTDGIARAFSGITVGISTAGDAGMSVLEVIGDPAVAGAINNGLQQANRDMAARDREFQRQAVEIQAMVHEARNDSLEDLQRRTALQRQQQENLANKSRVIMSQGNSAEQVDTAKQKCLARGAQWVADKRHCLLQRSLAERRAACESNGGVLFAEEGICWRGTVGGNAYVSESIERTANGELTGSRTMPDVKSRGGGGGNNVALSSSGMSQSSSKRGGDAAGSTVGADCEPINQQGVRIPMTRIPKRYHCYKFSDERLLAWQKADMNAGAFFYEASSEQRARSDALNRLQDKAIKQCKSMGFGSSVSLFDEQFNAGGLVRGKAKNCYSNNRMGTTFWMCEAEGSFRCGERQ